jgi:adenylate cyclase
MPSDKVAWEQDMDAPLNFGSAATQPESDVVHWLTNEMREERFIDNVFAEMGIRLQRAGIPVKRATLHLLIYHPQWLGARIRYWRWSAKSA